MTASSRRVIVRLVAKFLVDKPALASRIAAVSFHAANLAREHRVPVPEPLLLDETGEVLGVPGVVSRFVEGRQVADPKDPEEWDLRTVARQLVPRFIQLRPGERDKRFLFDGNHQTLYFTRDEYPEANGGSSAVFRHTRTAVRKLQRKTRASISSNVLVHLDYWHGNVLWHHAPGFPTVLDWDFAGYGAPWYRCGPTSGLNMHG